MRLPRAAPLAAWALLMAIGAAQAMSPSPASSLASRAARCELDAVGEAVDVIRTADDTQRRPQVEALRQASGRCTRFVLAVTPVHEVPQVCAAPESLTVMQTARELRRRMAAIDADALLRASAVGQACRAAYLHELRTTRVVLRERR